MKLVELTKGYFAIVDDDDFERVTKYEWQTNYHHDEKIYVTCGPYEDHPYRKLHHFILNTSEQVDHINRNGLDNRKDNLRLATTEQNCANRRGWKNSESGYKGVTRVTSSGRWQARYRGEQLGTFDTPEEAAKVYDVAAFNHMGEFAFQNFPLHEVAVGD